jgi:Icc-related predicted phosphoesterase
MSGSPARFLYVVDLHGDEFSFEAALQAAQDVGASAIVNGGDLLPHSRKAAFAAQREFLRWLGGHWAKVRDAGLANYGMFGNDDAKALLGGFDELVAEGLVVRLDGNGWRTFGEWSLLGFPWIPDPPFRLKDWCRHDDAQRWAPEQFAAPLVSTLGGLVEQPADALFGLPTIEEELAGLPPPPDPSHAIFVAHGPPAGIGLDVLGDGRGVGSEALRRHLSRSGFALSLHGHIHESPHMSKRWWGRLGATTCVNPGALERPPWLVVDLERRTLEHRILGATTF